MTVTLNHVEWLDMNAYTNETNGHSVTEDNMVASGYMNTCWTSLVLRLYMATLDVLRVCLSGIRNIYCTLLYT